MTPLYAMMHRWASEPFVWGWSDCALCAIADWHMALHGSDPAAHLRGTYDSPQSCQRVTGWFTDPVKVVEDALATVGGRPRVDTPALGDVAIIRIPQAGGKTTPVAAIWLGDCWGVRCEDGAIDNRKSMTVGPMVPVLAVWEFGYEG